MATPEGRICDRGVEPESRRTVLWRYGLGTAAGVLGSRTVQCRGDFRHAARSTVVFADALLSSPRRLGCFDPEEICTLGAVESKLTEAGITIASHPGRAAER